jgi:uncharacterized SAM-binding protein YcdF (DUF218 family)
VQTAASRRYAKEAPRTLVLLTAALALVFVTGYLLASGVSVDARWPRL